MTVAFLAATTTAIAANGFSGIAALVHYKRILPGMARAGVPESLLTFPIGTAKTAGAIGLIIGLLGFRLVGVAAAVGLVLFFICAIFAHVRARDFGPQFALALGFLALNATVLWMTLNQ